MENSTKIDPYGFREYDARWLYPKDINLKGINDGCTPLLLCGTSPNSFQCAKLLLELEAEIENRNLEPNIYHPNGATILRLAVINCCYDLADLLIEKGASLAALTEPCSNKADAIEFFEACRKICPEYYPNLYDTERLDKIFDIAWSLPSNVLKSTFSSHTFIAFFCTI